MKLLNYLKASTFVHPRGNGVYWALTCMSSSHLSCRCLSTSKISNMSIGVSSGASLKDVECEHCHALRWPREIGTSCGCCGQVQPLRRRQFHGQNHTNCTQSEQYKEIVFQRLRSKESISLTICAIQPKTKEIIIPVENDVLLAKVTNNGILRSPCLWDEHCLQNK